MITAPQLRELVHYDPETGDFTALVKRHSCYVGKKLGHVDGGYVKINLCGKTYKAHRLAWLYVNGAFPDEDIDHVNGTRSDNRWANLREASRGQNMMNIGVKKHNTSGWKGVSLYKTTGKWKAQIQIEGKKIGLGYYDDIKEAAEAYIFAALEFHGEFARLE